LFDQLCYLAAGRPVVAQDTGFSKVLPVGEGVIVSATLNKLNRANSRVKTNYHAAAKPRRYREAYFFDSDKVLNRLLANG